LRGDLEALRLRGFRVFLTEEEDLCVEERILSKLSRHESAIRTGFKTP